MSGSTNRTVGYAFGAVYLVVGLLGFTVSGGHSFAGAEGGSLLGLFGVNGLHNIVHLLVGLALAGAAAAGTAAARATNTSVGAVYLLVGLLGLVVGSGSLNLLALNGADNLLHFASAILLLVVGLATDRATRRVPAHQ